MKTQELVFPGERECKVVQVFDDQIVIGYQYKHGDVDDDGNWVETGEWFDDPESGARLSMVELRAVVEALGGTLP